MIKFENYLANNNNNDKNIIAVIAVFEKRSLKWLAVALFVI